MILQKAHLNEQSRRQMVYFQEKKDGLHKCENSLN